MSDNAGDVEVMEFYRGRDGRHLLGMRVAMKTRWDKEDKVRRRE